jgi:hypothetical protein
MKKIVIAISTLVIIITACAKKSVEEIAPVPPATPVIVTPTSTITQTVKTTYNANAKVIIDTKCATASCHAAGGQYPDCSNYTGAKAAMDSLNGDTMLKRMLLGESVGGFMPKAGTKSQADIDVITKWKADGLLEQ